MQGVFTPDAYCSGDRLQIYQDPDLDIAVISEIG